jgi:hypothetical protein
MNGWPDKDKFGYPIDPEIDGWHWLANAKDVPWPWLWSAKNFTWTCGNQQIVSNTMSDLKYLGPALTPAEVGDVVHMIVEAAAQEMNAIISSFQTEGETKH